MRQRGTSTGVSLNRFSLRHTGPRRHPQLVGPTLIQKTLRVTTANAIAAQIIRRKFDRVPAQKESPTLGWLGIIQCKMAERDSISRHSNA